MHSHSTGCNGLQRVLHYVCRPIINSVATDRFACGVEAGKWLYGRKDFITIANGIDVEKFCFSPITRVRYRQKLKIGDKFIIGNIGRFAPEKNHALMMEIFREICNRRDDAVLIMVGDGELQNSIREKVTELNLDDKVLFLNTREDVAEIMQAMDLLCMPSLFEGLPVTLIEAQAAGLPCVVSDVITREVDVTGNLRFVNLKESVQVWGDMIEHVPNVGRVEKAEEVKKAGYDVRDVAKEIKRMLLK